MATMDQQIQQPQLPSSPSKQQQPQTPKQQHNPEEHQQQRRIPTERDLQEVRANPSIINQRCVCELCSCGKHHCPRPRVKGIFQTSYQDHYKQFKFDQPSSMVLPYHYEMKHYAPDQLKSNYQEQYVKRSLPAAHNDAFLPQSPPKRYVPFNDETEYKRNYQEQDKHLGTPTRFENVAKNMILRSPVKFNANTSYNDHYKGYAVDNRQSQPNVEYAAEFIRSPIKFEGSTTYKNNYVAPPKVESKPVAVEYQHLSVPFKGESTYKNHFVPYRVENNIPTMLVPMVSAPPVRFEGKSAYQEQYEGKMMPPPSQERHERCICEVLPIPTVNYQDKPHLRFDAMRNQWV